MLESIKISNFAIISNSSVSFSEGFNVLSGETGAGKSLIVDALLFLTGVRADKTFIKSGEEFSRVEGVFSVDTNYIELNDILSTIGLENEGTIIISRQFNLTGKNECRINGEIVTLNIVRKVSSLIIDIFGQNDSQVLLDSSNHLSLLDQLMEDKLIQYKEELSILSTNLKEINNSIFELGGLDKDRENNIEFIKFQIREIEEANLYEGLEEELKSKVLTMQNSEKILTNLDNSINCIDSEYSVENMIKSSINYLSQIDNFDSDYTSLKDRLYSIRYEVQDILSELNNKKDGINYSDEEMDICQDRLMLIKDLERKYGNTISDILSKCEELKVKLDILNNAGAELERLKLEKNNILKKIYNICLKLREIRKNEISIIKAKLEKELQVLGMKNAKFEVSFLNDITLDNIENQYDHNGADKIEFLFSANLGVEPRPLDKIISGGEMSRFMLAFKSIQNIDSVKTCIFDEIDTGIGGEIGTVVGKKICEISRNCQVICITHLAQICSFGDSNFKIEKYDENNTTITSVSRLDPNQKIEEIARMLSGKVNDISFSHAREIVDSADAFKKYIASN